MITAVILILVSGAVYGFNQAYLFHFASVQKRFPKLKPNSEAWRNKYKNGDPNQGAKFFGSTTFLVFLTDTYHFTMMVFRVLFLLGFILLGNEIQIPWQLILIAFGYYIIIWTGGFHFVYSIIFK